MSRIHLMIKKTTTDTKMRLITLGNLLILLKAEMKKAFQNLMAEKQTQEHL